jgi:hypothetical protein
MRLFLHPVPAVLAVLLAATFLPRSAVAQDVTVSGVGYAQYRYQISDSSGHNNGFAVTRAYINVIGNFGGGLVTRITPDLYTDPNGSQPLRIKYAYAAYTPGSFPLTFKLGVIHTPWLDWAEGVYEYRMQGTMAIERASYITSADLGFGIDGAWGKQAVNMQLGVYNGEGYKGGVGDAGKDVMGRVSVRLLSTDVTGSRGGLRLTAYGQYGKPTDGGTRSRLIGMLSYKAKVFTVAVEGALTGDSLTTSSTSVLHGRVLSGFGIYHIGDTKASVLARVDFTDPDKDTVDDRETRFIGGISYQIHPHLLLLANVDHVDYQATPTPDQKALQTQGLFQVQFTF